MGLLAQCVPPLFVEQCIALQVHAQTRQSVDVVHSQLRIGRKAKDWLLPSTVMFRHDSGFNVLGRREEEL